MAAPDTSTTLAKLGHDGYRNTTLCNRFDNTYREWTTKTLAKRYGPLSISEEVFTQLLQDIRANGIHRTDEAEKTEPRREQIGYFQSGEAAASDGTPISAARSKQGDCGARASISQTRPFQLSRSKQTAGIPFNMR